MFLNIQLCRAGLGVKYVYVYQHRDIMIAYKRKQVKH